MIGSRYFRLGPEGVQHSLSFLLNIDTYDAIEVYIALMI